MAEHTHNHDARVLTLREVIAMWLNKKLGITTKQPVSHTHDSAPAMPQHGQVRTIAIVLDGEVQEVIRAENRMTALMLSNPEFVLVPDDIQKPTLGWKYENGVFKNPNEENQVSDN